MSTNDLLWMWSLTAQAASVLMVVGFFAALRRSFPTPEVRIWTWAWAANLLSLAVTFVDLYWVQSVEGPSLRAIFGLYVFGRGWFVVQMMHGLWLAAHPGAAPLPMRVPAALIGVASLAAGLYLHDYTLLSLYTQAGALAGFFAATLLPTGPHPLGWAATDDELHRVQASLRAMVDVDALTGLASRAALRDIVRSLQGTSAGVLFLDLRGFKAINDGGGHQAGDDALRHFASALRESFRPEDAAIRYGGDEFVVVARGVDRTHMMARVADLRARLATAEGWPSRLEFDVGYARSARRRCLRRSDQDRRPRDVRRESCRVASESGARAAHGVAGARARRRRHAQGVFAAVDAGRVGALARSQLA